MGLNELATPRRNAMLATSVDALSPPQFARPGGRRELRGFPLRFGLLGGRSYGAPLITAASFHGAAGLASADDRNVLIQPIVDPVKTIDYWRSSDYAGDFL